MIPKKPVHPGEILLKEFLEPHGITQIQLARHLEIPVQRINELIKGKRGVTPGTAWLLAQAFSTSPALWTNLQAHYELARNRPRKKLKPVARGKA